MLPIAYSQDDLSMFSLRPMSGWRMHHMVKLGPTVVDKNFVTNSRRIRLVCNTIHPDSIFVESRQYMVKSYSPYQYYGACRIRDNTDHSYIEYEDPTTKQRFSGFACSAERFGTEWALFMGQQKCGICEHAMRAITSHVGLVNGIPLTICNYCAKNITPTRIVGPTWSKDVLVCYTCRWCENAITHEKICGKCQVVTNACVDTLEEQLIMDPVSVIASYF